MGKEGPLPQLEYKQMKELSSLTWTPREKSLVNEGSKSTHYDNMHHNIKSFVQFLASVQTKELPVSNDVGLNMYLCVTDTVGWNR